MENNYYEKVKELKKELEYVNNKLINEKNKYEKGKYSRLVTNLFIIAFCFFVVREIIGINMPLILNVASLFVISVPLLIINKSRKKKFVKKIKELENKSNSINNEKSFYEHKLDLESREMITHLDKEVLKYFVSAQNQRNSGNILVRKRQINSK